MTLIEQITEDVQEGLKGMFSFDTLHVMSPFDEVPLTNGGYSAQPWAIDAVHDGDFAGIAPTGARVTIEGVTIVQHGADDGSTDPLYLRYVDWAGVFAQLGVGTTGRPVIDPRR
jgi:hypothetical protein